MNSQKALAITRRNAERLGHSKGQFHKEVNSKASNESTRWNSKSDEQGK
jgi:hypothetical protein